MSESQSSVIVGVFEDPGQAQRAYERLRALGFGDDYLGLAQPQQTHDRALHHLEEAGIPAAEAAFYRQEFRAGRALVTVRVAGLPPESARKAVALLEHYGAYDAHSGRARQSAYAPHIRTEEPSPYFDLTHPADLLHCPGGAEHEESEDGKDDKGRLSH